MGCCCSKSIEETPSRRTTESSIQSGRRVIQAQPEFDWLGYASRRSTPYDRDLMPSFARSQRTTTRRTTDGDNAPVFTIAQNTNSHRSTPYDRDLMPSFARSQRTTTRSTLYNHDLLPSFARSQRTTTNFERDPLGLFFTSDHNRHPLLRVTEPHIYPSLSVNILKNIRCVDSTEPSDLQLVTLAPGGEYNYVKNLFMKTTQPHYRVLRIVKIVNKWLEIMFYLKKQEYELLYGRENVGEKWLFHGTSPANVNKICRDNFSYRMGNPRQMQFGHGVYFTPISNYASHYHGNQANDSEKPMFVVKVLYHKVCEGNSAMFVPPYYDEDKFLRYDTAQKPNGAVWVKFDDDEYCPHYVIYYTGTRIPKANASES